MSKQIYVGLGVVLLLLGLLWFGQGMGWIGGSPMTGQTVWAVVGPIIALVGVGLVLLGTRKRS